MNRSGDFDRFRETYQTFNYTACNLAPGREQLTVSFEFDLDGKVRFNPSLTFPKPADGWKIDPAGPLAARMAFCIGMVELASYWKTYCPPQVNIRAGSLTADEASWWRKLYYLGLAEFFFTNGIATDLDRFLKINAAEATAPATFALPRTGRNLIPVGGGKDSIVSLELLRPVQNESSVFLLSAPRAARECARLAGYAPDRIIEVSRTLDPALRELNAAGALNGHTPFSALLAFVSLFAAALSGAQTIVLSNESSANEPTVLGSEVNHQYSKSFAFEQDFRAYVAAFLTPDINYFSLLRPISELQIGRLMSTYPRYFAAFRSCNEGSREGRWCGHCAKCLFSYLMLQPFCPVATMVDIFGADLLADARLQPTIEQLLGLAPTKPFDCVGTVREVRAALSLIASGEDAAGPPRALLQAVQRRHPEVFISREAALEMLLEWNPEHHLPPAYEQRVRESCLFS